MDASENKPDDETALAREAGAEGVDAESTHRETEPSAERTAMSAPEHGSPDDADIEGHETSAHGASIVPFVTLGEEARTNKPSDRAAPPFRRNYIPLGLVAGLGCLALVGIAVEIERSRDAGALTARIEENQTLASAVNTLRTRLDAIEAARGREETTDLRKVLGELKTGAAATRDFGASLTQLSARVDHIEKDQGARLDKLGDRIDHDSSARLADIVARLDKIEKKPAPAVVAVAPQPAPPPKPAPPAPPKPDPGVSYETTGSIEKPRPRLHGYALEEVRDGFAIVDTRYGPQSVTAGDFIPGAGRVLRIERQGHDWLVVTTLGVISGDLGPY
jgi:hypothetical protein